MRRARWILLPIISLIFINFFSGQPTSAQTAVNPIPGPGWLNAPLEFDLSKKPAKSDTPRQTPTDQQVAATDKAAASSNADDYITALARGLENDPKLIFEFVNNHIDYDPVRGWRNDAPATLFARSGSDADQATLFVELMRAAGFTANYRKGDITYSVATLANLVGSENSLSGAGNTLANAGHAITLNGADLVFERIWAEATIDGQTFQFDPAMKTYAETASLDVGAVISYNEATFRAAALAGATTAADSITNMNEANVRSALETHAMELVNHIQTNIPTASVEEIISQREIVFTELAAFSTDLPNAISVTGAATSTNLPSSVRPTVRFQYEGIDQILFTDQLSSGTLSLHYNGSNRPVLTLNGVVLDTGNALTFGDFGQMTVTIDHPFAALGGTFGDQAGPIGLQVGNTYTFLYDFGAASLNLVDFHSERLFAATGDGVENETLAVFGQYWAHEARLLNILLARQADHISLDYHTFGVVFNTDPANGGGHGVDIPFALNNLVKENGTIDPTRTVFRAMTVAGSAFEHGMLEQMDDTINAVSTIALLTHANATGEEIFLADLSNWQVGANIRAQLTGYSANNLAGLDNFINAGLFLVVPQKGDLAVDDFEGLGVIGASDSSISMLISGGLNGGFATTANPANGNQIQKDFKDIKPDPVRQEFARYVPTSNEPVEMVLGNYLYSKSDLRLGDQDHFGLDFRRNYNSGSNHAVSESSPLGNGWRHTLDINVNEASNPDMAMGNRQAVDVAQTAVTAHIMLDLLDVPTGTANTLTDWLSAALVANWHMDQLTNNATTVDAGNLTMTYQRLADGSYAPPPTITHELTGQSGSYQMDFTDGSTLDFDASDRATTWQDANGNTTTFTYTGNKLTQVSTSTGYSITFTYTGDLLTSATDMSGRSVSYSYDADDNLTSATDAEGHIWRYGYDADNQLTNLFRPLDAANPMMSNTYDEIGQVIQQIDGLGNVFDFFFAPFRTVEQNPDDSRSVYRFNHKNQWTVQEDTLGNETLLGYDGLNHLTQVTGRDGDVTQFSYDLATARIATQTDALGRVQTSTYAARAGGDGFDLAQVDFADGTSALLAYDADGNPTQLTDQAGKVWTITYNAQGLPLTITNPSGGVSTFTYNADGTRASSTDSDIGTTTYSYDTLKRLTTKTYPDATTMTMVYDALDRITSVTDERGNSLTQTYDADGRRTQTTDADGNNMLYGYDDIGQITTITSFTGDVTAIQYDGLHRVSRITDPTGVDTDFNYDSRGRTDSMTILGFGTDYGYNNNGFLTSFTSPLNNLYTFSRDAVNNLTQVVDPLNQTDTLAYDALNRIQNRTDPLNRTTTYGYDPRGLLNNVTLPLVGNTTYTYDNLNNLDTVTDLNGKVWDFGRTNMGRHQSLSDPLGNTLYQHGYDNRGRVDTTTFAGGATVGNSYDDASNFTGAVYSDGTNISYSYDNEDRIIDADGIAFSYDDEGRPTNTTDGTQNFAATYDGEGRVETVTYANGLFTVTYVYSGLTGLLTQISDDLTNTTINYNYDLDLRLTQVTRSNGVDTTLSYDNARRLTRIEDGNFLDLQYTYDDAGQVTGLNMVAPLTPDAALAATDTDTFGYDDASRVNSAGYSYDSRGRLTADPNHTYTWDDTSRLKQLDGATFSYDGLDLLHTRTDGGNTTAFHYNAAIDDYPIMAEENVTGGGFDHFYVWDPDGTLLYMIDVDNSNQANFYHFDLTGSTLALTDENGDVTDGYAYTPFGKLLGHSGSNNQPFTFVGGHGVRQEGTTGDIFHMGVRYYDAETQRFLTREFIFPQLDSPEALNPYQYALNRPVRLIDPSGLSPESPERSTPWINGLPQPRHTDWVVFISLLGFGLVVAFGLSREAKRAMKNNAPVLATGASTKSSTLANNKAQDIWKSYWPYLALAVLILTPVCSITTTAEDTEESDESYVYREMRDLENFHEENSFTNEEARLVNVLFLRLRLRKDIIKEILKRALPSEGQPPHILNKDLPIKIIGGNGDIDKIKDNPNLFIIVEIDGENHKIDRSLLDKTPFELLRPNGYIRKDGFIGSDGYD